MEPLHPDDPRELGPFRLLRRVGEGGMGVVFLAVSAEASGEDLAAVKVIRPEYSGDREFRARFASEVELARRVRGPYTARVLAADTDGARPWLATEYVPGPSLHQAVRDSGPFPESSLRVLAAGLAEALSAIHGVGLVHRDLKPSNVLLSPRGPQVIDFGIARAADATQLTRTGQALGTPAYMSPEQAVGTVVDPRSDLFSFGGVLLFSATGRQPFGTGNAHALLYRVVNGEPDLSGVPEALRPLVTGCLAKDPDDRPELASVLAELSGSELPRGDDDPTEWLPEAVATQVRRTLVRTRAVPTLEATAVGGGTEAVPREEDAPAGVREEGSVEGGQEPEGATAAPSEDREDSPAEDPEGSSPEDGESSSGADQAPVPLSESDQRQTPDATPEPEEAGPRTVRTPSGSSGRTSSPAKSGTWGAWKVGGAVVAVIAVVALIVNNTEDPDPWAGTPYADSGNSTETSPSPSPTPSRTPTETSTPRSGIRDGVRLGESDRFAMLSDEGVYVFESGRRSPREQLTDRSERFAFSYSHLATTPDGSHLASKAVKSANDGVAAIHVWDLEEDDRSVVELPDADDGGTFALSPDGATLYFNGDQSTVTAYRVDDGEELYSVEVPEAPRSERSYDQTYQGSVTAVGTSPEGDLLVAALDNGVAVWDAVTGEPHPGVPELRQELGERTQAAEISGGFVVSDVLGSEKGVEVWEIRSDQGPRTFELPRAHRISHARVREVSVGDGGDLVAASGIGTRRRDSFMVVWDSEGEVVAEGDYDLEYTTLNASPGNAGLLVSTFPVEGGAERVAFLDEGLEPVEEFTVPTR